MNIEPVPSITVVRHPLIENALARLRARETDASPGTQNPLVREASPRPTTTIVGLAS